MAGSKTEAKKPLAGSALEKKRAAQQSNKEKTVLIQLLSAVVFIYCGMHSRNEMLDPMLGFSWSFGLFMSEGFGQIAIAMAIMNSQRPQAIYFEEGSPLATISAYMFCYTMVSRWVISLLLVEGAFTPIMFGGVVVVGLSYAAVAFRGPKGQAQILGGFIILSSIVLGITGLYVGDLKWIMFGMGYAGVLVCGSVLRLFPSWIGEVVNIALWVNLFYMAQQE